MPKVVFSTITQDVKITKYGERQPNRFPPALKSVIIKGGANSPTEVGNKRIYTPRGVATVLSDEDMDFVQSQPQFLKFMRRGFITIGSDERDAENAARDMTPKDKSAVMTEAEVKALMAKSGVKGKDGDVGKISTGAPA